MIILEEAYQGTSYLVVIKCRTPKKRLTIPESINWSLKDPAGNIVNNRDNVSVPSADLAEKTKIPLEENDLPNKRAVYITITATYNTNYGSGYVIKNEAMIPIEALTV